MTKFPFNPTATAIAMALAASIALVSAAIAQTTRGDEARQPSSKDRSPSSSSGSAAESTDPRAIFREPLLRESSQIVDAPAEISRDADGAWIAIIDASESEKAKRTLTLLPCARLAELQRIIESTPPSQRPLKFKLSGQVYVYHDVNYLLPTHAPVVVETQPLPPPDRPSTTSPEPSAAEKVLRDLETASGSHLRTDLPTPPGGAAAPQNTKTMREGTLISNRRGKLARDGSGAWTFVFDADANGAADPPVKLLPCLLLERIEDHAKRRGPNAPATLNGTVYVYANQNYLLPTVFLIPHDRRNITP